MQVGALITAAGMSSRMGDFKPMLNIGSISIAQRIVATLQKAGVNKIVMVTGYNALALERHLANNGIIFLRNENYETTQMFDSVKIGLEYLKDKCDRILFTPVDIPLFTSATVEKLMHLDAQLACPIYGGEKGHPIMIASGLVDSILSDCGEGGLSGAMERCGEELVRLPVEDEGILHDADTPADYEGLLRYHNEQLVRQIVSVSLAREKVFFDSKTAMLLGLIDETGSVRSACMRMQISYSSGWNIIKNLESQVSVPLITSVQGGPAGGKSRLTEKGKELLRVYSSFEAELGELVAGLYEKYFAGFFKEEQ